MLFTTLCKPAARFKLRPAPHKKEKGHAIESERVAGETDSVLVGA
jgi:hypothetical protein